MGRARRAGDTAGSTHLFQAAALSYAANCALGTAVGLRLIDTRRIRWVHHGLYVTTSVLSGAAVVRAVPADNLVAAAALVPAAVPLALIPRISARSRRHPLLALTAAPFFVAAVLLSRR